jgi:hypothetical protein
MPPQKFNKLAGKHVLIIGGTSGKFQLKVSIQGIP